jgi:putative hydrolase of the HAD superfamily
MASGPVRAVVFDYGGVIWNMRWDVGRALEIEHGLPRGAIFESLYRCDAWSDVERGRGDRDAWMATAHAELERRAGRPLPPLHEQWRAAGEPIAENVALIRALRPRYRLGVLSNADLTLRARLADGLGIIDLFDDVVCSAEVGCAKPEPEIYALACQRLGVPPGACVFVDDHAPNVEAATALGMRGIVYRIDRGDDLRGQLAAAGIVAGGPPLPPPAAAPSRDG